MNTLIKAVWIDDEWEKDIAFIDDLHKTHNIKIVEAFRSRIPGVEYIKQNYLDIDVLILDAWFTENDNDKYDETGKQALIVKNEIENLIKSHPIEIFLYTAHEKSIVFQTVFKNRVYIKAEDEEKMIKDITLSYKSREDVLLKKKFKLALEACTEKYIGIKNHDRLFRLLKNQKDYSMSEIRKILQSTFNALQEKNIIPSREMGISNEAEKSRFFAGKKAFSSRIDAKTGQSKEMKMGKNYQFKKKYMTPKPIATIETHLWSLTSDWSHDQNADSDNPDLVIKDFGRKGALYNLCEILTYIKKLVDKKEKNEQCWNEFLVDRKNTTYLQ